MFTSVLLQSSKGVFEHESSQTKPENALLTTTGLEKMLDKHALTFEELFLPKVYNLIVTDLLPRGRVNKRFFQLILGLH